jgi:trigger factor
MKNHSHSHSHGTEVKNIEKLSSTRVKLSIEFDQKTVQKEESATTQRYLQVAKIPGFRPGKAPIDIIQSKYGEEIKKEVISHLLDCGVNEALEKTKLWPLDKPKVHIKAIPHVENSKTFSFEVEFDVKPEITLKKYKEISLKNKKTEVTDKDIENVLTKIQERYTTLEPSTETSVKKGLFAVTELSYHIPAKPERKEEPKIFNLEVGSTTLLPELDEALSNMKVGDKKTVKATYPKEYPNKELAGLDVVFECHVQEIKKKVLPELNDEFANTVKAGSTLEAIKKEIAEEIAEQRKAEEKQLYRNDIISYLTKNHQFDVPTSIFEQQKSSMVQSLLDQKKKKDPSVKELSEEEIKTIEKNAAEIAKGSLLLSEIAEKENIQVDEKEAKNRFNQVAQYLGIKAEEISAKPQGKNIFNQICNEVLTDQIYDFLIENAKIE